MGKSSEGNGTMGGGGLGWQLWRSLWVRSREWLALAATSSIQRGKGLCSLISPRLDRPQLQL